MAEHHATERLWLHARAKAGTAVEGELELPRLPKLKMRELAVALRSFAELISGWVPPPELPTWKAHVERAKEALRQQRGVTPHEHGSVKTTASWDNLGRALRQASARAVHAPPQASVAQKAVVGIAFTLIRQHEATRAAANARIRDALARLEAAMWLESARSKALERAPQLADARAWWADETVALFEGPSTWWLVRQRGRRVEVEPTTRDDALASVSGQRFDEAVRAVLAESTERTPGTVR